MAIRAFAASSDADCQYGFPASTELGNLLAEAYQGNNQIQEAIETLRKATQLAPEATFYRVGRKIICQPNSISSFAKTMKRLPAP